MANGIYEAADLSGRAVIRCTDCKRWVDATGGVVVHSSRCSHKADATVHGAGPQTRGERSAAQKQAKRALVKAGLVTTAFDGDENAIAGAVRTGRLTASDALNRDD